MGISHHVLAALMLLQMAGLAACDGAPKPTSIVEHWLPTSGPPVTAQWVTHCTGDGGNLFNYFYRAAASSTPGIEQARTEWETMCPDGTVVETTRWVLTTAEGSLAQPERWASGEVPPEEAPPAGHSWKRVASAAGDENQPAAPPLPQHHSGDLPWWGPPWLVKLDCEEDILDSYPLLGWTYHCERYRSQGGLLLIHFSETGLRLIEVQES